MAATKNYQGAIAVRFFLGVFEAAVTPGFALFTSQVTTRHTRYQSVLLTKASGIQRKSKVPASESGSHSTAGLKSLAVLLRTASPKALVSTAPQSPHGKLSS